MNGWALRELLRGGPIVADGAMGTSLMDRGVPGAACFDELNVDDPDLVLSVHRGFVDAGATFVTANTFGANRYRLGRFQNERRVGELNRAGVEVAKRAGALVAGSVGPLGVRLAPYGRVRAAEAFAAYREQVEALVAAGSDFILIETQSDLAEMEQALAAARDVSDIAVAVTATFARDDRTPLGDTAHEVAHRLVELEADAIGVNCSEGPAQVLRLVHAMRPHAAGTPVIARPNAGSPRQSGGRYLYPATPGYFAEHARMFLAKGASVVGGCCGTGPEHIAAIAAVIGQPAEEVQVVPAESQPSRVDVTGDRQPTAVAEKLVAGSYVIAVEMDPPKGFSAAKMLAGAQTLAEAGADVIDVADSPMARMRMSPWAACRIIQEAGIETILHFPTRGRNLLRLQGDLLAVHALGIRNVFVCMGDPVTIGDYPGATDNVDVVPTALMQTITESFNEGSDRSGASIGEPTSFVVGCAISPNAGDLEKEVKLLHRKIAAGCSFGLSQPMFTSEPLERLRAVYRDRYGEDLTLPVLVGVLPLVSSRHAEFLHNEVPGIVIPDDVRDRMRKAGDDGEAEGLALARDFVAQLRERAAGIYLMPPFERFDLAAEVVEAARTL